VCTSVFVQRRDGSKKEDRVIVLLILDYGRHALRIDRAVIGSSRICFFHGEQSGKKE
jgi:hypothetical protein